MSQALRHLSRGDVRHRLSTGRWQQVHRSVFVAHSGPVSPHQRSWIAVLAVGDHAVLAGITAARAWGLRGYGGTTVHLLVPATRKPVRVPADVRVHRTTVLDERDLLAAGRPIRTRMPRSLIDAAQWAGSDTEARAIIAAGFQQRLVRGDDVIDALDRLPRARRRRLIASTAADAAGGAHSLAEIDFLELCRANHLPEPSRQVVRRDATGRRRYLDAYFDQWRVHVEIDGGQHLDPRQAWLDMQRQNDVWIAGDRLLRFPAWALRTEPAAVATQVRAALISAGWPGST
jgi:very-short-patch-repair endonuclease